MMYHDLPRDASFWLFLFSIDQDLAHNTRKEGCPCGGRLHCANYPRKPRGGPDDLPDQYRYRLSFCCNRDGCRKRVTPPSVRFLGWKVYLGAVVILVAAMRQGPSPRRVRELSRLFGADRRTIARWQVFWREHVPQTPFWKVARSSCAGGEDRRPSAIAPGSVLPQRRSMAGLGEAPSLSLADHDCRRPENRGLPMISVDPQKMRRRQVGPTGIWFSQSFSPHS